MLKIKVENIEFFWQMVDTRMPFRYGSAKLVRCPHLYMVANIRDAVGAVSRGIASDNLPPKWFDKLPEKDFAQELSDQIQVAQWAAESAINAGSDTPFRLWWTVYNEVQQRAAQANLPKLLAGFGPSLVERAVNDATGKLLNLPFFDYLKSNAAGVELGAIDASLQDIEVTSLFSQPRDFIYARHTVGLSDPIRAGEIPTDERLNDGLPQSLDEAVRFYGVRYFKIKVCNQLEHDIARLEAISALMEEVLPNTECVSTLDGNEQYESFEQLLPLLDALEKRPSLRRLAASIEFIEQPLARAYAFDEQRCRDLSRVTQSFPVIIDEADDAPDALPRALALGYSGTSHKNCKNTFKSVANIARLRREKEAGRPAMLSAEDLTNIGVVALQEDLTALSALGISHAERNGHHYFTGLAHLPREVQTKAAHALPDLYTDDGTLARLHIYEDGRINTAALHHVPGLGVPIWPDLNQCHTLKSADEVTAAL
jgi:hypothetical protein